MFTIRPSTKQDIATLDALLARAYPRLLKPDYPPSVLIMALPLISRAQPALITSGTYFVVEHERQIIGAGGWTAAAPGASANMPPDITRGVGHIRHVVTDDRAVRRGVGRALVDHIFANARAQGLRRLRCLSTRTAVPFYAAMGFAELAQVTISLAPGIDFPAVNMQRDL